ncbi:hypothetical protein [Streptomyces calidiresistens]|uniref:Uncharacterized protein n=1 Tax=Streptomyces calidiresistens TaxID=1485586 RepID=A0A7W3T3P8_9ACTN|nr:hypothetical protein [Streptomyces calidiresistens]MBB0230218.1 hypothetical protein [Streptomyces calidiresistens]
MASEIFREILTLYGISGFICVGTAPGLVGEEFSAASPAVATFDLPGVALPGGVAEGMLIDFLNRRRSG